jgi:chromosome partitioning protein
MTVTVAVVNEKGGVGKTTTAITVGAGLARRGKTVAIVDCDPQGHVAKYLGLAEEPGVFDLLVNDRPIAGLLRPVPSEAWAEMGGSQNGRLVILPGNQRTTSAGHMLTAEQTPVSILRDRLAPLQGADVIILDTSPTITLLMAMIYVAADRILIPTQPELGSVNGVSKAMSRIETANDRGASVRLLGVLPLMWRRTNEHSANIAELVRMLEPATLDAYEAHNAARPPDQQVMLESYLAQRHRAGQIGPVFSPITQSTLWPETPAYQTTIFNYVAPQDKVYRAAQRLIDEVEHKLNN